MKSSRPEGPKAGLKSHKPEVQTSSVYIVYILFQFLPSRLWTSATKRLKTRSSTTSVQQSSWSAWWRTSWGSSRSTSSGRRGTGCSTTTLRGEASGLVHFLQHLVHLLQHLVHFIKQWESPFSFVIVLVFILVRLLYWPHLLLQRANRSSGKRSSVATAHCRSHLHRLGQLHLHDGTHC